MKMTPFEADLAWNPRSPLKILAVHSEDSLATVSEFKNRLEESFLSATFPQRLAQSKQAAYNSKNYTPLSYDVGDKVYLSKKLFTNSTYSVRPSEKLCVQRVGPFEVIELIGKNAVRLALPDNIKIHPVVHVEHTARAYVQPAEISQ